MNIVYKSNDWGFRIKQEGDNYWLGYMNEKKDDLQENRINREIFFALKLWWGK